MKDTNKLENPLPNLTWYQSRSKAIKEPLRCPFASARLCPRYYHTLFLLGQCSLVERMSTTEVDKVKGQFEKSPLFSREFQPQPELTLSSDRTQVRSWWHCCPEVIADVYAVFATSGSHLGDTHDAQVWHRELESKRIHPDDWRWNYTHLEPAHFSECREFSILAYATSSGKRRSAKSEARSISPKERWQVFARDSFTCKYCGRRAPEVALTVDHVVPVSGDGTKDPGNLVTACQDCNSGKSNRPLPKSSVYES